MNYIFQRSLISVFKMSITSVPVPNYRTYIIESWHRYQSSVQTHFHSILHYNAYCEKRANLYGEDVMVLRDEVTKITGYYWCTGWSIQNCADTDGYVDVRTGKKYPYGKKSFCEDIRFTL